jgi:hypothetical protein
MLNQKMKKILAALFLGFVLLFLIRFLLSFLIFQGDSKKSVTATPVADIVYSREEISYKKRMVSNVTLLAEPSQNFLAEGPVDLLQVYQKEAKMKSLSSNFDEDEKNLKVKVKNVNGNISYENNTGLKPHRFINVVISISPQDFDSLVLDLKKIGELSEIMITKEDKTQEFRTLYAKRGSLVNYQKSLIRLRSNQGKVEEFISLEEKIQEIEKEIQSYGVQLGEFVEKESFCNIAILLMEYQRSIIDEEKYPLESRLVNSFIWAIKWYFLFLVILGIIYLIYYSIDLVRK